MDGRYKDVKEKVVNQLVCTCRTKDCSNAGGLDYLGDTYQTEALRSGCLYSNSFECPVRMTPM